MTRQQARFLGRVWSDPTFKQRVLADPTAALGEQGISVPKGVEVRVVENTDSVVHLVLPPSPADALSDEQLEAVAGGDTASTVGSIACGTVPSTVSTFSTAKV